MECNNKIPDRFKVLRQTLNLSQRAFAEKIGVSRDVVTNIEYGRVEPKDRIIDCVCKIYNVNPDWLKNGIGEIFIDNEPIIDNTYEAINIFQKLPLSYQEFALKQIKILQQTQFQIVDNTNETKDRVFSLIQNLDDVQTKKVEEYIYYLVWQNEQKNKNKK